ncbi:sensor histidine kinase [Lewinella sp. LCG006]|uniref:sensor histidine kinase n=1 Tax=Lewinella sp. LCG006 TaxID=3231911 RepID=UPI003460D8D4
MQNSQLRFLTYFIMGYMLLAFVWWSFLLFTKNRDAFQAKIELQQIGMAAEGVIKSPMDFYVSERYQELVSAYRKQERMIMGETIFLSLSLLAGIYVIYRGYRREVDASRQQRNFLLSITHELKSPLAGIRLALETIAKRGDQLPLDKRQMLSQRGIKEADRLNKLVEDLLLSARLESAYQFHQEPLDLQELTERIVLQQSQQNPEADIEFICAKPLAMVSGDRQALTSVVINLIENALKYSPPPAKVTVALRQEDKLLHLEVADQGIGINAMDKKRVFEKFYRVGSEDTRKTKGTGLGLFIVKELIRAHHGTIKVRDNQPQGTIFAITLPVMTKKEEQIPSIASYHEQ